MTRWFAIPLAFALIAASGIANGIWDNRWYVSHELTEITERVANLPLDLGHWKGEEIKDNTPEVTQRLTERGTITALKTRVYRNTLTNETVSVLIATGRPGPISTHNPMTCIVNKGVMKQSSNPVNQTIEVPGLGKVGYTQCNMRNISPTAQSEEWSVFWTWHSKAGWVSATNPRLAFASYRALTKVYVTRSNTDHALGLTSDDTKDSAVQFLEDCLPLINQALYGPEGSAPENPPRA